MHNYYFAVASRNFLINEEPIEEILRERTSYYKSINKDIDFWFISNPTFIDSPKIQEIQRKFNGSLAAIVSFDKNFIQWLKLRISFVIIGDFQSSFLIEKNQ